MTAKLRTKLAVKVTTPNMNMDMDMDIPKGVKMSSVARDIMRFYVIDVEEIESLHKFTGELLEKARKQK